MVDGTRPFPRSCRDVTFEGNDADGIKWTSIQPRVGVTYALGEERKTLLRGSLGRFADPMFLTHITRVNPVGAQLAAINFVDDPGGRRASTTPARPSTSSGVCSDSTRPTRPLCRARTPTIRTWIRLDGRADPRLSSTRSCPSLSSVCSTPADRAAIIADYRELFVNPAGNTVTVGAAQYVDAAPITFSFPG